MRILSTLCLAFLFFACTVESEPASAHRDDSASGMLIIGNKGEDSISLIDLSNGRELKRLPTSGPAPHEIATSPDGKVIAVVHYGGNGIELFDVKARKAIGTINLPDGARPHGLVWLPDGRMVATAEGVNAIAVIRPCGPNERCTSPAYTYRMISTGQKGSHMVAVSPDGNRAYVANLGSASVTMVDVRSFKKLKDAAAGKGTEGIAITADGKEVWASARPTNKAYIYDAATLKKKAEVDVGKFPLRIIASPDGKHMVTSNLQDGSLSVIDVATRTVVRTISVLGGRGEQQVTIIFSPDGSRIYAALTGANKIAEIDFASGKQLRLLSGGTKGDGLAIVPAPQ